jgi:hypothetical protein
LATTRTWLPAGGGRRRGAARGRGVLWGGGQRGPRHLRPRGLGGRWRPLDRPGRCPARQVRPAGQRPGPRRLPRPVTVHHGLTACRWVPTGAHLLPARRAAPALQAQPAALHGSPWSARSRRSTPRWPREWSSPGAWSGRGKEAAPPKGRQPGSRSPGRSHLRPSRSLKERTSRSSRPPPSSRYGAAPVASCTAAQTHLKTGRMSRLSRPVSCRSGSGGKPWTAITRPACFSPPSRGSSTGQPCCLIRHRPSRRYHRNRRYPRSRNRRYRRNRRYHQNRPRRSGRSLGVIRLRHRPSLNRCRRLCRRRPGPGTGLPHRDPQPGCEDSTSDTINTLNGLMAVLVVVLGLIAAAGVLSRRPGPRRPAGGPQPGAARARGDRGQPAAPGRRC